MSKGIPSRLDNASAITALRHGLGERRFRLFLSGCLREMFPDPLDPIIADAFERSDRFADTGRSKSALSEAKTLIQYAKRQHSPSSKFASRYTSPLALLGQMLSDNPNDEVVFLMMQGFRHWTSTQADERLLGMANEIVGPDDAPEFDAAWRTSDVIELARGIYKDRAFVRMPILSDALMDAGCESTVVLEHCRSNQQHVRGCWVLDVILANQWEIAWQEPKAVKAKKAAKIAFKLDRVCKAEFERQLQFEAKLPLEEAVTETYLRLFTQRQAYLDHVPRTDAGKLSKLKLERQSYAVLYLYSDTWNTPGIVRRISYNDPAELARYGTMTARIQWVLGGQGLGYWIRGVHDAAHAILTALAIRDDLAVERFAETCAFPSSNSDDVYYDLVLAGVRGDWNYVRSQTTRLESDREFREPWRSQCYCVLAIAEGDPKLVATRLTEAIAAHKRFNGGRVTKHISVEAHGLYELARRRSPELVEKFDLAHPPPWDAEYHAWGQANERPLPDIDWDKLPEEIRAGLRDLPRPAWWGVLPNE